MGLLGILSLLQIGIIPGVLITAQLKLFAPQDRTLLVLPLSCIANYFLVIILTLLGVYNQIALLIILFIEVIALLLYAKSKMLQGKYAVDYGVLFDCDIQQNGVIRWLVILLVFFYTVLTFKQIGTVFTGADAVVSWNKWAIDWFNGISPRDTFYYPQLLPALYSLTYQFMGSVAVELFAKLVAAFFPIMLLLTFLRVASLHKNNSSLYLLGMLMFWFAFSRMIGSSSAFNGYADLPLAYFVLVSIYIFNLAWVGVRTNQTNSNFNLLLLCAVVIAGGAITKHSALYLAAIMPLVWYFHFRDRVNLRQIVIAYIVMLLVAGHWFIYKQSQIYMGADSSNLQALSEIVVMPWYAKLWHGVTMISSKISWLWIPLLIAGVLTPLGRAHAVWIFVPYFLLWALFASYDYRNLILALPSFSYILASGMMKLHEYFHRTALSARIYRGVSIAAVFSLVAVILFMLSSPKIGTELVALQNTAKRATGVPEFNEQLYAFFEVHTEPAKIASTYYALGYLPGLKERDMPVSCNDLERLADNHAVRYLIAEAHCPQDILYRLSTKYKKRLEGRDLIFYEVVSNNLTKGS